MFVLENAALPHPKRQKLIHKASVNLNPIHSQEPNTSTPINISEDELTENKGGDTDSQQPIITLSNVSTSLELQTLDPVRDIPRSYLSGEARQFSGNSSLDEPERVYHTSHPSQGLEGNVGSLLPHITLPTSPLPDGTFPAPGTEVLPTKCEGKRQVLGKSSSDGPSTIFYTGTSIAQDGMRVSETPTKHVSVRNSPQILKPSERARSETPTERTSEKPQTLEPLNLDNYVTKEEFDREIFKRDQ